MAMSVLDGARAAADDRRLAPAPESAAAGAEAKLHEDACAPARAARCWQHGPPRTHERSCARGRGRHRRGQGDGRGGAARAVSLPPRPAFRRPDADSTGPALSPAQQRGGRAPDRRLADGGVTLLDGVTGSGKTEVYFEAVAAALRAGRQALVLLPEIALTRASGSSASSSASAPRRRDWHSDLTGAERRAAWRAVADGEARVVVGARSALFLPFPDLGLIVVDEEHEPAFKQEDGVIYQARDMAVVRGHLADIPVLLASATPSLETLQQCRGRAAIAALHLPDRHAGAALPKVSGRSISGATGRRASAGCRPALVPRWTRRWPQGEQALLFLNRRGYAPLTLCRACGHRMQCPNCTAWLVEHRYAGGCNAIIAAIRPGAARPARPAARRAASPPAAPASSGWRRRRRRSSPRRASR